MPETVNASQIQLPEYEDMVKAGMHFGRKKTIFHPGMKPFVYTLRDSICIIDLVKTRQYLLTAIAWLRQALAEGKLVLFVGLSEQSAGPIQELAGSLNLPYVTHRWLGGTLTNFKTVISRVQHLEQLEKKMAAGEFEKYTKKERLLKEREIAALKQRFDGLRKLTRVPDILFVASAKDSELAIREAKAMKVKVVGLVNTETDPKQVDYPIPANDNARRSIELIIKAVKESLAISNKSEVPNPS